MSPEELEKLRQIALGKLKTGDFGRELKQALGVVGDRAIPDSTAMAGEFDRLMVDRYPTSNQGVLKDIDMPEVKDKFIAKKLPDSGALKAKEVMTPDIDDLIKNKYPDLIRPSKYPINKASKLGKLAAPAARGLGGAALGLAGLLADSEDASDAEELAFENAQLERVRKLREENQHNENVNMFREIANGDSEEKHSQMLKRLMRK